MTARALGDIAAGLAAVVDPDRRRDRVWRHSYDVDSPEGKPWLLVLDGTRETWRAMKTALKVTCAEHVVKHRRLARFDCLRGDRPSALRLRLEAMREDYRALVARERARSTTYPRRGGGSVTYTRSTASELAREVGALQAQLSEAVNRLRIGDEHVLAAFLDDYNVETGELFTAQETIAAELGMGPSRVNEALQRLRHHGYLNWVRRSRTTDQEGLPGWQRAQASNGYFFDWKKGMEAATWSRFWQLAIAGLKKIGKAAIAETKALFTRVVKARLLGRPLSSPAPGSRAATKAAWLQRRQKRDSPHRIYPGPVS